MKVLFVTYRLRAQWCNSLKDKRSEVKKLLKELQNKFNVSVCESGFNDKHEIIEISVATLVFDRAQGDAIAENLTSFIESRSDAVLFDVVKEYR